MLKNEKFDLVLLDMGLPDSTGINTFNVLHKSNKSIPYVILTGLNDKKIALEAIENGAQDYLSKDSINPELVSRSIYYAIKRKQYETELIANEKNINKIIENSTDGILLIDTDGVILFANNASEFLFGKRKKGLIGSVFGYPLTKNSSTEIEIENKKDPVTFVEIRTSEISWGCKMVNIINMRDITGRKLIEKEKRATELIIANKELAYQNDLKEKRAAELIIAKERAEESDRLKSAFLTNMSHEIRTPMNGILGFASLLKEQNLTGDEQQNYIRIIEKSGARMLNIINDIISISKIESGLMEVDIQETDINQQIDFIHSFFKLEIEEKGIHFLITKNLKGKAAHIQSDSEKIYSILTNIVKNAIKFTEEGTIELGVQIKIENGSSELEFYIKDTGIGIPKDRLLPIFSRFIQADVSGKMAYQGAGLGLSISKSYVEILGGKIWVESEVGKGSTFYFTLPYRNNPEEKIVIKNEDCSEQMNQKVNPEVSDLKILIAEDNEISGMLLSFLVKDFSKKLFRARTGIEAVNIFRNNPDIDLILMDIQMPELNGDEATRQIRQFNKEVIIIAQTGLVMSIDKESVIESGCNDYISKPIKREILNTLIQKYFKK